jgi:O-antigen ligase
MIVVLCLLAILGMAGWFFTRPLWGLAALVVTLPFERLGSFALTGAGYPVVTPSQVVGAAVVLAVAARLAARRERWAVSRAGWWLVNLAAIAGVSAALVAYRQTWIDYVSGLFVMALCLAVAQIIAAADWQKTRRWLNRSLFASAAAVCLFGLYQFVGDLVNLPISWTGLRPQYTKAVFGFPRIQSTALEPLYFANYLLMPLLLSLAAFIATKKKWLLGAFGLIAVTFALTVSRGAVLGALIALPILFFGLRKSIDKKLWVKLGAAAAIIAILVVGGLGIVSLTNPAKGASALKTFAGLFGANFNQTGTLTDRLAGQKQAWDIFLEKPLIGHGVGGYTWRVLNYPAVRTGGERVIVNNEPLELLTEVGILGELAYLGFLVTLLWQGFRAGLRAADPARRAWLIGLTAAIVAIWIQYLSFSGFFIVHIWVTYGLLLGLISIKPTPAAKEQMATT